MAAGIDVEVRDHNGHSPLIAAVQAGKFRAARWLLRNGAAVDGVDKMRRTALHLAAFNGSARAVRFLLHHGADWRLQDCTGSTALMWAMFPTSTAAVKALLQYVPTSAVSEAPNKSGVTPLHVAASMGRPRHIRCLLRHGALIDARCGRGQNALLAAANAGGSAGLGCVTAVLRHCGRHRGGQLAAECDEVGWSAVHALALDRSGKGLLILRALAPEGLVVAAADRRGRTPLHAAAVVGATANISILLAHGHSATAEDNDGHMPIWYSRRQDHIAAERLLRSATVAELQPAVGTIGSLPASCSRIPAQLTPQQ